ncbi:MAG: hypothetical protein HKN80_00750 [Acidimicrobiia bacterium]|nr:hypothetical protein [Acidimicrobiia bacterium]
MVSIFRLALAAILLAACGGSSLSMAEYGDRLEEIRRTFEPRAEAAWVDYLQLADPTLQDLKTLSDREVAVRLEIEEALRDLTAPSEVREAHDLLTEWTKAMRGAGTALGKQAGRAGNWDELLASDEYQMFEKTLSGGTELCFEFQARLDASAARGAFADTPWIPGDLSDVADAVIGCETIPEDLDGVLRP